jgi:cell division protein FtsQ
VAKTEINKNTTSRRGPALVEEEPGTLYRPEPSTRAASTRSPRVGDNDADEETFLRTRRRVPVRKGILPRWAASRGGGIAFGVSVLLLLTALAGAILAVRAFLDHDSHFRIDSSSSIQILGNSQLSRADLLSVFGSDIGRNIFFVPLGQRRAELEQIPWVKQATVMRILPNQLRVAVTERTPVAFVRLGSKIALIDGDGVLLDMPPQLMGARHFNFPVLSGIDPSDPLSSRAARVHLYLRFLAALNSSDSNVSDQISEVDLSDPEDVRATLSPKGHEFLLHFGDDDFLTRYRNYVAHIDAWEQQYPALASIDLRYDDQVVLKMAGSPPAAAAPPAPTSPQNPAKAASAKARSRKSAAHHSKASRKGGQ